MQLTNDMLAADLDRQLADWGATVTHQSVVTTFDPETLINAETVTETELTAIVSAIDGPIAPNTGGQYVDPQVRFIFRTADLPALAQGALRRIVHDGTVYDIVGFETQSGGAATILMGRERQQE